MLTKVKLENFKSWEQSGELGLAPITGFFGTNSSGKTALLQALLLLKQTAESVDRSRPLHLGDERSYVDLGTFHDVIFAHEEGRTLSLCLEWQLHHSLKIRLPDTRTSIEAERLAFTTEIRGSEIEGMSVEAFSYDVFTRNQTLRFGMKRVSEQKGANRRSYDLISDGYEAKRTRGRPWKLPPPTKCYGFPDEVNTYYQNVSFLADFVLAFERQMERLYYLGPLREYPKRIYVWSGEQPAGVGLRGELAVHALLAADRKGIKVSTGYRKRRKTVLQRIAEWLKELGLIYSFDVRPLAEHRKEYEVRVRRHKNSPEVALTDVGFGVSQILPVLTLCYYAPEGSTLLLEQPEIHLHPSVQAGLADVFIDAVKTRRVQIIVESHSEHLLRRLQRRIAEEQIEANQMALYFITCDERGASHAQPLEINEYGYILNWPEGFFGDEMGELVAMADAAMRRQKETVKRHQSGTPPTAIGGITDTPLKTMAS